MKLNFRKETPQDIRASAQNLSDELAKASTPLCRAFSSIGTRKVGEVDGSPILEFIGVSEGVKRDGSKIQVGGIDLRSLQKNPVFLWAHDYSKPPIGRIVDLRKTSMKDLGRVVKVQVAPLASEDLSAEHRDFSKMIFSMMNSGDLRTVSFGWATVEADPIRDAQGFFSGWDFKRSDGLEFSAVPVPADPDAIITAVRTRGLSDEMIGRLIANRSGKPSVYSMKEEIEGFQWANAVILNDDADGEVVIQRELVNSDVPANLSQVLSHQPEQVVLTPEHTVQTELKEPSWMGDLRKIMESLNAVSGSQTITKDDDEVRTELRSALNKITALEEKVTALEATAPAGGERKGAVLNAANRQALINAANLIGQVLKNAGDPGADSQAASVTSEQTRTAESFDDILQWVEQRKSRADETTTAASILGQLAKKRADRVK